MNDVDIGIDRSDLRSVALGLQCLFADTYSLYLKTHNYHWNVEGQQCYTLRPLFEEQQMSLSVAIDDIAERIRMIGGKVPGTFAQIQDLSCIKESELLPGSNEMIVMLKTDNETISKTCRELVQLSKVVGDESTLSLVTERLQIHESIAWHLRSICQ